MPHVRVITVAPTTGVQYIAGIRLVNGASEPIDDKHPGVAAIQAALKSPRASGTPHWYAIEPVTGPSPNPKAAAEPEPSITP